MGRKRNRESSAGRGGYVLLFSFDRLLSPEFLFYATEKEMQMIQTWYAHVGMDSDLTVENNFIMMRIFIQEKSIAVEEFFLTVHWVFFLFLLVFIYPKWFLDPDSHVNILLIENFTVIPSRI